jgi:DNA-binding NtrC family response regulator
VSAILSDLGYRVLEAVDAGDALRLLREPRSEIALLLTDVIKPKMRGHELAELALAERPGLRVLLMSGFVDDLSALRVVWGRRPTLLAKPFAVDALAAKVREALE